ncbi:hypothetical protein A3B18_01440 [Candidatus Giovannonibacteria bacterium RIFCSPLOWO2_01_FULL_46_13]|uniref:GtrA/DPMS transmembrane domain-containing protein n=1 Tax=Candidatus Giovannonibacteria bacterium RIFCSPLOWO2_01_FULL_46_13 TaxID=1798352 RepID=A0A1F5X4S2_9BACT|nr:MAG: hypothetical protein A3B18_01440 [Candidatus Giovannonibacteria bacterium RIFCSPLOWO2_01_FULL_46_13]
MKKDILISAVMGFLTGLFLIPTVQNNNIALPSQNLILLVGLPILSVIGIIIARKLGEFISIIFQLGKFVLTGILNAAIDFGILNILIVSTGAASGLPYTFFKSASFIVANFNSYFWNKTWTFQASSPQGIQDYVKFLIVSLGGLLLNVGVASLVVNFTAPFGGLDPKQWANMGAVFGAIASLAWNFLGYKFVVFVARR